MTDAAAGAAAEARAPQAQVDGGTFEVVRKRLEDQGRALLGKVDDLDRRRRDLFGTSATELLSTVKVRTENACVARDIIAIGGRLLLGCDVRMGLKSVTAPEDVFTELAFVEGSPEGCATGSAAVIESTKLAMLSGDGFAKDFRDIHQYYKDARLLQLRRSDELLLAAFQTGQRVEDVRVLRWRIDAAKAGEILAYLDNHGDRDYVFPPSHDFAWTRATRDMQVQGAFPHVNILDTVFVECVGGDLTVKVENNTATGAGIYAEPVKDATQSLDDAEIHFAQLEGVVLLKIRPYREPDFRYIVFNQITREASRIDAIGSSCQQLPEGHGLIFPGGFYLASGSHKVFPHDAAGMEFARLHRSPNGEDLAYVYYERVRGVYVILKYNLIAREVAAPLICHGYCLLDDGRMVALRADDEPTRLHTLQVWKTPFASETHAAAQPNDGGFLGKLGNRELVRGISDLLHVQRLIGNPTPSASAFTDLLRHLGRVRDSYHWLGHQDACGLQDQIQSIQASANAFLGEFEKAAQLAALADQRVSALETTATALIKTASFGSKDTLEAYVKPLAELRRCRGAIAGAHAIARVDGARLDAIDARLAAAASGLSAAALEFLGRDEALAPYRARLAALEASAGAMASTTEALPLAAQLDEIANGLDLLVDVVNTLAIDDLNRRTAILEAIGETYALLNRSRAILAARRKELGGKEGRAAFAAQAGLFGQAMANALALCDTPDACDDGLARLSLNLEEMEGRFADFEDFLVELASKRADLGEAFAARKQMLLDERQNRAEALARAVERLVQSVAKRAQAAASLEDIEALFASDQMAVKARSLLADLRGLGDTVKADDGEGRLKAAREEAVRRLRDRGELFDGETVRLGRHRFSVNTQPLDLAMVPRPGTDGPEMYFQISGTDYAARVADDAFRATRRFWNQPLPSENAEVYRGEYLAWRILDAADHGREGLTAAALREASLSPGGLLELVRVAANARPDEGYDRGIHDADAAAILKHVLHLRSACGRLRFSAQARALGTLAWSTLDARDGGVGLRRQCRGLASLRRSFGHVPAVAALESELATVVAACASRHALACDADLAATAGAYLLEELGVDGEPRFARSSDSIDLERRFVEHVRADRVGERLFEDLASLRGDVGAAWRLLGAWLSAYAQHHQPALARAVPEVTAFMMVKDSVPSEPVGARTLAVIGDALGAHPRIQDRRLEVRLDEFEERLARFARNDVPAYRDYQERRRGLVERERAALRLDEFKPRVLTSFVRNRLVDEVYLPLIGDNLAKQMGAAGAAKRTDLMGLLLLISPPGYGKTTLIEYVASVLGLAFVKINGPAIGHGPTSLDPAEAANATARQELEKLNLALEMGNNVMIILDDIQHVSPELLQKFISLCDGQRRIEGVWRGTSRTYDLRGKKLAVVMAGNPYTESGERFRIPDMLANRADTYNLGDILGGHRDAFELSYLENSLTSNPALAPVATRPRADFQRLLRMSMATGGADGASDDAIRAELEHPYSAIELEGIVAVLRKLRRVQQALVAVNQAYIASAGTVDEYRTEPPFRLQGSYRNMAKLAEKIVPAMDDAEVERLLLDHYTAESQTLATGAEASLLKLKELIGAQTAADAARWAEMKRVYVRRQELVGGDDPASIAALQLAKLAEQMGDVRAAIDQAGKAAGSRQDEAIRESGLAQARLLEQLERLVTAMAAARASSEAAASAQPQLQPKVEIVNTLPKYYAKLYEHHIQVIEQSLVPAIEALSIHAGSAVKAKDNLKGIAQDLRRLLTQQQKASPIELSGGHQVDDDDDTGERSSKR